jgi:aspartate/methionine/tyrosine aminotransferase
VLPEPFALERYFARHEFGARHLLSASDCEPLGQAELLELADDGLRERWESLRLGYTESQGLPELRAAVAASYQSVQAEQVLIAAPEEAIFLLMNAVLERGDHVVCTFPGYQSLYQLALALGCEVSCWRPAEEHAWRFDPEDLARIVRPATRLIVWNFPHNPTGALPSPEDFDAVLRIAEASGAYCFSDEMYRLLELDQADRLPAAVDRLDRAVSLAGMSKVFGMAGVRIGWLAC